MSERRVVIYGNAVSGKTKMARSLGLPVLSLDAIAWSAVLVRAPLSESLAALERFMDDHTEWVIEGCYEEGIQKAGSMSTQESPASLQKLLDFLDRLDARNIYFKLDRCRSEAIMVRIDVPGERWEVEFLADGDVQIEVFKRGNPDVGLEHEDALERLFLVHGD